MCDSPSLPLIRVNDIGEYIRYHSCDRRFKLAFNNRQLAKELPFAERLFNSIDPVLQEAGRIREDAWEVQLLESELAHIEPSEDEEGSYGNLEWNDFVAQLATVPLNQNAYGREVRIRSTLEGFQVEGRMDFVLLLWEDDTPKLRIVECKASRKDRTYHRIQVAVYRLLMQGLLDAIPLTIESYTVPSTAIDAVVARIDESTSENQAILGLPALDLETESADARKLLTATGPLARIVQTPLAELNYQIEQKCDDCVFSVHCLPESARLRSLHLLGLEPSTIRVLGANEVTTIDALAALDLSGESASAIRANATFTENLELLQEKARARRQTLPGGNQNPDEYEVGSLRNVGHSQLPTHEINGHHLIRVYLSIEYDYVENRIGALAAHVTKSEGQLHTGFITREDGRRVPNPEVIEQVSLAAEDTDALSLVEERALQGADVIRFKRSSWTGNYDQDCSAERELIQDFLMALVDQIAEVAQDAVAPIHFYMWTRGEMSNLVEGCSRAGSHLLSHLRELLGCRESLDQLIYSSLSEEVNRRYALGWTGKGLVVVSSLRWFGKRYHWKRRIAGQEVNLDHEFTQDIFDFKTTLDMNPHGEWAQGEDEETQRHRFEIRSRFTDSLSAPYWRAYWRTLPAPATVPAGSLRNALNRYNNARQPCHLEEYLRARVHALRWIEERIGFKNAEIEKPFLEIASLPDFSLHVNDTAQAAIDFLRLDQHIHTANWTSTHLVPPLYRMSSGKTIPVVNVVNTDRTHLQTQIDLTHFDISYEAFQANCSLGEGSFVRLTPCFDAPTRGQTVGQLFKGGFTCKIDELDWDTRLIRLSVIPSPRQDRYRLLCRAVPREESTIFTNATIDESPSAFVAPRVDHRLQQGQGNYVFNWFHPNHAQIPPQSPLNSAILEQYQEILESLEISNGTLDIFQIRAAIDGLSARVQLIQGPPGTGKTATTAAATLLRILARRQIQQVGNHNRGEIVLIAANTHTAVDNLLCRIDGILQRFRNAAEAAGFTMPAVRLSKVHSSALENPTGGSIEDFIARPCLKRFNQLRTDSVLIIGGTTGSLLKMAQELNSKATGFRDVPQGFQASTLIVDEASMIVFPHFLSLATLIEEDGEIMLAGDHRQLAPIVAHDWEREDRPPVVLYQPYASAYEAVLNTQQNGNLMNSQITRSALSFTFRLPPPIRNLLTRIYERDNILLDGSPAQYQTGSYDETESPWDVIFNSPAGLYLVLHDEMQSKRSNETEAAIIQEILSAEHELPAGSVAIVTPHRAQRSLLRQVLSEYYETTVDVIDTVERLQGDERPTVIVSATASDPSAISKNVEFILDLNRSNVAFSRTQARLIVVCARTLLDYIPADYEHYESAMLWKALRELCSEGIMTTTINGHEVNLLSTPPQLLDY